MSSLNKVMLIGRLGKDPEIVTFANGGKAAKFPLATSKTWKDKDSGERKERTEWHNVVVYSPGLVGTIEKFVKKGAHLYIEGEVQTRSWDDSNGQKRYMTEIVLNSYGSTMTMLGKKSDNTASASETADAANAQATTASGATQTPADATAGADGIPF